MGRDRVAFLGTWHPAKVKPPQYYFKNKRIVASKANQDLISHFIEVLIKDR